MFKYAFCFDYSMDDSVCPDDKTKKAGMVCKHKYFRHGKYEPCEHYKGAGCAHPRRYLEEDK